MLTAIPFSINILHDMLFSSSFFSIKIRKYPSVVIESYTLNYSVRKSAMRKQPPDRNYLSVCRFRRAVFMIWKGFSPCNQLAGVKSSCFFSKLARATFILIGSPKLKVLWRLRPTRR